MPLSWMPVPGLRKFNVNTEAREAYVGALRARLAAGGALPELLELMGQAEAAMQRLVAEKLALFGSAGRG